MKQLYCNSIGGCSDIIVDCYLRECKPVEDRVKQIGGALSSCVALTNSTDKNGRHLRGGSLADDTFAHGDQRWLARDTFAHGDQRWLAHDETQLDKDARGFVEHAHREDFEAEAGVAGGDAS